MKILIYLISLSLLAGLWACEPKPPKPKTDFTPRKEQPMKALAIAVSILALGLAA